MIVDSERKNNSSCHDDSSANILEAGALAAFFPAAEDVTFDSHIRGVHHQRVRDYEVKAKEYLYNPHNWRTLRRVVNY